MCVYLLSFFSKFSNLQNSDWAFSELRVSLILWLKPMGFLFKTVLRTAFTATPRFFLPESAEHVSLTLFLPTSHELGKFFCHDVQSWCVNNMCVKFDGDIYCLSLWSYRKTGTGESFRHIPPPVSTAKGFGEQDVWRVKWPFQTVVHICITGYLHDILKLRNLYYKS